MQIYSNTFDAFRWLQYKEIKKYSFNSIKQSEINNQKGEKEALVRSVRDVIFVAAKKELQKGKIQGLRRPDKKSILVGI
jgi:hypothetical protein